MLTVAICVELVSTWVAVGEFNAQRGETGALAALKGSKDPALFTVVLEDLAALIGLVIALAGNLVADQLGWLAGDAAASIAIGCVLAGVSAFMSRETMSLLIGEAASAEVVDGVRELIDAEAVKSGAIRRIHTIRTMHLGPQDVLATVRIDFEDTVSAARVETIVGDLEWAIKARFPEIRHLFLAAKGDWLRRSCQPRPNLGEIGFLTTERSSASPSIVPERARKPVGNPVREPLADLGAKPLSECGSDCIALLRRQHFKPLSKPICNLLPQLVGEPLSDEATDSGALFGS